GEKPKRKVYFSSYTLGRDYHVIASKYLRKICSFINELGGETHYFVDDTSLPERYLAYKSGIGFIGKNNTVITKKYGSNIFLGEIITSLFLEEDSPIENECGECDICVKACPTKSIGKNSNIPNVCISYITQKKYLEDKWFDKLGGRIFGCDTCQDVCPFNNQACLSPIEDFRPYEFMKDIDLENIINMNDDTFKEKYSLVSASWMGKEVLQRNAIINAFDLDMLKDMKLKKFKSSYLADYYIRLTSYYDKSL
ncbi:MAG: tRNA epoxyqueuosine(34) reductase QueG, partial [Actinomycetota bacterium]|nr:tRNA epoxyqueuosine(34) reductase QueG [Actinomycetota bacterium]